MGLQRLTPRRAARGCWMVVAVAGLGAAPPDAWDKDRVALPPVVAAPDAQVVPASAASPNDIPRQMPAKVPSPSDAPAVPPAPPVVVPAGPTAPAPAPAPPETPPPPVAPAAPATPAAPAVTAEPVVPAPVAAPAAPYASSPARVYVINGVDPAGLAGLSGTADRLRASGYDTRTGAWYQARRFEREIRELHRQQPGTPVAVIGYSFGSYPARAVVNRLTRDGVPVAMLGYIGADYLSNNSGSQPAGVGQVVNVRGNGYLLTGRNLFFNGTDLTGANNLRLPGVRHFDLPKREETVTALLGGLDAATGRAVAIPEAPAVAAAPTTPMPSPTPVTAAPSQTVLSSPASPSPAAMAADPTAQNTRATSSRFNRFVDRLR